MRNSCTPCLLLVSDKIDLELGFFVGISTFCVAHPRPGALRNAGIQPGVIMHAFRLPPAFYTLRGNPAAVPPRRRFVSEGGFQRSACCPLWRMEVGEARTGIWHPWNFRSVFWLQTSQNVRVGGRLSELSAGDTQEKAEARGKDVSFDPD